MKAKRAGASTERGRRPIKILHEREHETGRRTSVRAPRWKADSFVLVLLAFSLALNAYLGVKIKNLSAANDTVNPTAAIGSFLETLDAHTTEGEPQTIRLTAGKAAVIYIFSPECRWCERNLPNITYLAAKRNEEYELHRAFSIAPQLGRLFEDP